MLRNKEALTWTCVRPNYNQFMVGCILLEARFLNKVLLGAGQARQIEKHVKLVLGGAAAGFVEGEVHDTSYFLAGMLINLLEAIEAFYF